MKMDLQQRIKILTGKMTNSNYSVEDRRKYHDRSWKLLVKYDGSDFDEKWHLID